MKRSAHLSDLHSGADPVAQPKLYEGLLGPVKTTPFASITNLTTGKERPCPLTPGGEFVTVTRSNCPARTLLRLYWPLER